MPRRATTDPLGEIKSAALADQGLRVLAVAEGSAANGETAKKQHDYDFTLLGLVAFEDHCARACPRPWRRPSRPASRWR